MSSNSQLTNPGAAPTGTVLLTTKQAATQLQISQRSVFRLLERGDLKSVSLGKSLRVHVSELDRLAREGVKSLRNTPVNRAELDSYIDSVEGPLRFVLTSYRDALDGKPFDVALADSTAIRLAAPLLHGIDVKIANRQSPTNGERLAVRYLGSALVKFSEAQAA
jgi:excisionase family DNA binding protein